MQENQEKNVSYWNQIAVRAITDEIAFTELYKHFFPRVYKFLLMKTNDADIADEIVSQTFLKMYEHLSSFDEKKEAFSTWLYHIAENELKMFWRSKKNTEEKVEDPEEYFSGEIAPEFDEPEHRALDKERQEQIHKALEKLPDRERKIIEFTYSEKNCRAPVHDTESCQRNFKTREKFSKKIFGRSCRRRLRTCVREF